MAATPAPGGLCRGCGIIDANLGHGARQILFNLLNNACKFTQRGSIAVRVARETEDDAHWVTVAGVSDTGTGIPQEQLQGLFDSFGQAGNGRIPPGAERPGAWR